MTEADLSGLVRSVLLYGFAVGVAFGAVAQRTHFCTMGAIADVMHLGDWSRMRMWVLAMAVAIIGFNAMVAAGWVRASASSYAGTTLPWLSLAIGGGLFGIGMVLASGCGAKTLVRVGGGNLKSLTVFVVLGVSAFMTLKGVTALWRVATTDAVVLQLPVGQDLPSLLAHAAGSQVQLVAGWLGAAIGAVLLTWVLWRREGRSPDVLGGGLAIGLLVVLGWWLSGRHGHLLEHPQTLEETFLATSSQRMESLSFVAPVGYLIDWLMYASDSSRRLGLGTAIALGVVAGSAAVALGTGSFRWEGFRGVEDTASHLAGAVLMGVGGVTALGCTIGQGVSGVSTLSLGSTIAVAGIVAGAVAALKWQAWRVERQG